MGQRLQVAEPFPLLLAAWTSITFLCEYREQYFAESQLSSLIVEIRGDKCLRWKSLKKVLQKILTLEKYL